MPRVLQYTVSMSAWMIHRNEDAFPDPGKFDPERWLGKSPEELRFMEKCYIPFSRGSRSCLGQNLAMCELYVGLGTIFRRFDNLTAPDVGELTYIDYFAAYHPEERQKLRVTARDTAS